MYYSSTSNNGGYELLLTFKADVNEDMALVNVNNAVKLAEHLLPTEVVNNGLVVVKRSADMAAVITFQSSNPEHTDLFLSNYVSINIKDAVSRIDGVGQAVIFCERKYSMRIWLDPNRMRAMDIGHGEVAAAIGGQNAQAATGAVGDEFSNAHMQYKIDAKGRLATPGEFANIVVRTGGNGRLVKLGDISTIELGSESYGGISRKEGEIVVAMAIFKLNDANALKLVDTVKTELARLSANFPDGITWNTHYDSTKFVRVAMAEIVNTLILTFILVVAITYLFLQDWRATLVPTLTIPVSLFGTFIFLYLFNLSINTLTMFALILVIGSVVDNAICVVESCARLIHEEKLSPLDAALKSMEQLTSALIATTLVVVAIYLPIAFYGGMVGIIYTQFAVTMCIALVISTVNALTLSPALCAIIMRDTGEPGWFFRRINRGLDFTRGGYLRFGGILARRLGLTVVLFALIIFANYWLYAQTPSAFLPNEDKGAILCDVILPPGASLARTEAVLAKINAIAREIPGVNYTLTVPQRSLTAGEGENLGLVILDLKDWSERTTPDLDILHMQQVLTAKCAEISDASVTAFIPPAIMGLGATGGVSFSLMATGGQTPRELSQAANHLIGKIMETGKALYAFTSFDADTPMLNLDLDRDKAEAMNIPVNSVFSTLQTQLGSIYVNDFNLYSKIFKVKIQSAPNFRNNLNSIGSLSVTSKSGHSDPLTAIARVNWILGPRQAERFNMFQSAGINTQSHPSTSSGQMMEIVQDLVRSELSHEYQIGWTDMSYQESQNTGQIVWLMLLALIFGYLFLVAQYESWAMPIPVFLSVATATLGGLMALRWHGQALNIYCQLGLLMLIGLTAKTAILMVEYAKQERDNGATPYDAAMSSMKMRFRAVMMTGLSFVFGVAPLVVATGAGSGSRRAIGQTTFWGMAVAMALGMVFIPGLYVLFQRMGETSMSWLKNKLGGSMRPGRFSRRFVPKKR